MGASHAAQTLLQFATDYGVRGPQYAGNADPLGLLRLISSERPDLTNILDQQLRVIERAAVRTSLPNPGARGMLQAANADGRTVAIVSNNDDEAIGNYLRRMQLIELVSVVAGRPPNAPLRLKPDPYILEAAAAAARMPASSALMIGDSVTDIRAAHAVNVPCIGYANKRGKFDKLKSAGADMIVESLTPLEAAFTSQSRHT